MFLLCNITSVLSSVLNVFLAFVILMFMVTVHEFGHYISGSLLGFKINEFAVGMGPKVFSRTRKNGQVFSLRIFPLGGFCAFEGEDEDNQTEGAFNKQAPWKRLIVLFSGAAFNFLSALLVCAILFASYGETVATVSKTYEYASSAVQTLDKGDVIYSVNGKKVYVIDNISKYFADDQLEVVVLTKESGYKQTKTIKFDKGTFCNTYIDADYDNIALGIVNGQNVNLSNGVMVYKLNGVPLGSQGQYKLLLADIADDEMVNVTFYAYDQEFDMQLTALRLKTLVTREETYTGMGISLKYVTHKFAFGESLTRIVPFCGETGLVILRSLGGLFTGATSMNDLGGPITTISTVSTVVSYGFSSILLLIVLISVNLAVFNLLPVPSLDGCRMVFVLIEWITGKPVNRNVEAAVNGIGLILLIGLMIVVDLMKL